MPSRGRPREPQSNSPDIQKPNLEEGDGNGRMTSSRYPRKGSRLQALANMYTQQIWREPACSMSNIITDEIWSTPPSVSSWRDWMAGSTALRKLSRRPSQIATKRYLVGREKSGGGCPGPLSGGCRVVVDGFLVQALGLLAEGRLGILCGMPILAVNVQHSSSHRSVDLWESQRSGKQTRRERRDAKIGVSAAGRTPSDGEGSTALHI